MKKSEKDTTAPIYTQSWVCVHEEGKSQIEAYDRITDKHELILQTLPAAGHSAKEIAEFIVRAVNTYSKYDRMIEEMTAALEVCLECDGLDWAAEHDAEIVLRRARQKT